MTKIASLAFLIALFTCSSPFVFSQKNKASEVKSIEAYCKTVDGFTKRHKSPQLVFADVAEYNENAEPQWRKFVSEKTLEKFREKTETYTIALNWQKGGKIVASNFTVFSPSGDWAQYIFHYFREDGSLAKAKTELRTFYGDLIVVQDFYYDRRGRLQKKTLKSLDLQTRKPKKPDDESIGANSPRMEVEYFKTTSKLPFSHLLKKNQK